MVLNPIRCNLQNISILSQLILRLLSVPTCNWMTRWFNSVLPIGTVHLAFFSLFSIFLKSFSLALSKRHHFHLYLFPPNIFTTPFISVLLLQLSNFIILFRVSPFYFPFPLFQFSSMTFPRVSSVAAFNWFTAAGGYGQSAEDRVCNVDVVVTLYLTANAKLSKMLFDL